MSERYTQLKRLEDNLYAEGSPVIIKAGALLRDNSDGRVLAQLKFENFSPKKIISLKISITALDAADRPLGDDIEYRYMDVFAEQYQVFGTKTPVYLPDNTARSYIAKVTEVIFEDKSVWTEKAEYVPVKQKRLDEVLEEPELISEYKIKTGEGNGFFPERYKDLKLCACGEIYKSGEEVCPKCGRELGALIDAADKDTLAAEAEERRQREEEERKAEEERRAAERAAAERKAAEDREKRARLIKRAVKIGVLLAAVIVVIVIAVNVVIPFAGNLIKYNKAALLAKTGNYDEAIAVYEELDGFMSSEDKIPETKYQKADYLTETENYGKAAILFGEAGDYKDSKEKAFSVWNKIANRETISAGNAYTIGLKSDGTITTVGFNGYGQCNVEGWHDIVAVSAGGNHTVGLKSDGTVTTVGNDEYGQRDVYSWRDIVAVSAGVYHTVGLKSDGTVVAVGDNYTGRCDVDGWRDIAAVSAGAGHTVGLKSDGTVVAVGLNSSGECVVDGWRDIVAVSAGWDHTVGLKSDGTVAVVGRNDYGQCNVEGWHDIVAVSAGGYHTVGLKSDGTVVAVGYNGNGKCNVEGWHDIVAVSVGANHTVGLKSDGRVVAVGWNEYGQCNVSDFSGIKLPEKD